MAVQRRSQRRSVLVLLVLTWITLVTLDLRVGDSGPIAVVREGVRDAFAPVETASDALFSPLGNFIDGVTRADALKEENQRLQSRLAEAEGELARARGLDRENRVLRGLLDLDFADEIETVAARVVSLSPGNFEWSVTIDRGRRHGLEEAMPVVSGQGLVGRVIEVSETRAKVLLLTDPRMAVGIRLTSSRETGVTQGLAGKDVLQVDLVDPETPVEEDELVVTSGLQQARYPPGIPVGTVVSVSTRRGALQKDLRVAPLADLDRLEFIDVLLWKEGEPTTGDAAGDDRDPGDAPDAGEGSGPSEPGTSGGSDSSDGSDSSEGSP